MLQTLWLYLDATIALISNGTTKKHLTFVRRFGVVTVVDEFYTEAAARLSFLASISALMPWWILIAASTPRTSLHITEKQYNTTTAVVRCRGC